MNERENFSSRLGFVLAVAMLAATIFISGVFKKPKNRLSGI
ncbi:MAG: hypothetical protein PUG48_01010 [Clostridia bacterium]|nr:hypothetical protein [Clostridia bacterium]